MVSRPSFNSLFCSCFGGFLTGSMKKKNVCCFVIQFSPDCFRMSLEVRTLHVPWMRRLEDVNKLWPCVFLFLFFVNRVRHCVKTDRAFKKINNTFPADESLCVSVPERRVLRCVLEGLPVTAACQPCVDHTAAATAAHRGPS